jgi:hypothetical protein
VPDLLRALALLCCLGGLTAIALAMEVHWQQLKGPGATPPRRAVLGLRAFGAALLAAALALCLRADHASMAVLVWVMSLGVSALVVAFALAWRR